MSKPIRSFKNKALLAASAAVFCLAVPAYLSAKEGRDQRTDQSDRAVQAAERADRDTARAAEKAAQIETRYADDRAKIMEDAIKDPFKATEDLAKLEADRQKEEVKLTEDAAKNAADYQEELAKAAEDAAKDADDLAEYGSSNEMRDLATEESPEFDKRGFPVRRGELVALDMRPEALGQMQAKGFRIVAQERLPSLESDVIRLAVPDGMKVNDALQTARQIDPGGIYDFTHYYGLQYSPAGKALGRSQGSLGRKKDRLTIGMIDTAVMSHPALGSTSIKSRDFGNGKGAIPVAHGTAVASILASEGSSSLYVANIFRGGTGSPHTSADALVGALEWMVANKVPVVNISLSGPRNSVLDKLVERSIAKGTVIVAAAGNGGPSAPPAYPAAIRPVVAVTAVDKRMRVYRYANQGRYITVAARGVAQTAANSEGGMGSFSGTSFASPHIAAWMARCLKSSGASACTVELHKQARDLGEPGFDPVYGYGFVE